mgnify:CR=1 FL=1
MQSKTIGANADTLRSVIVSLSSCLNALDIDAGSWGAAERLGLFGALLNLCVDQRDRVRRVAQNGVHRILRKHASMSKRAETVLTKTSVQFFENILSSTTLKDSVQSVHTLSFMRLALPLLPASSIAVVLEAVLKLLALGSSKLTLLALRTVMNVVEAHSPQLSLGLMHLLARRSSTCCPRCWCDWRLPRRQLAKAMPAP